MSTGLLSLIVADSNPGILSQDFIPVNFSGSPYYECHVGVCAENDGQFSAFAYDLPGAVSCGGTVLEALANIREALEAVLAEYLTEGSIPWSPNSVAPETLLVAEKWIVVHA